MKKQFSILIIVGLCFTHFCSAQQVPSQNKMLDLTLIHLEKDFQLNTNKSANAIPINVEHLSFEMRSNAFKKTFEKTLVFSSEHKLITEQKYHNLAFVGAERVHKKYIYNSNNKLSNIEFYNRNSGEKKFENTKIEYKNGKLSKHVYSKYGFGGDVYAEPKEISYPTATEVKINETYTNKTFTKRNNLITKRINTHHNDFKSVHTVYKYDDKGRLIYSEEPWYVNEYVYNSNGFLKKHISIERINATKTHTTFYKYIIDAYGNWTMCMNVTNYSEYAEFSAIANPPKMQLRKITYANGKTTGTLDPEAPELESHINKFTKELRQLDTNTNTKIPKGVVWKRNKDGSSFWIYKDGQSIVERGVNWQMDNTQLFFYKPTHTLYGLKNFREDSLANTYYNAEILLENAPYGFFYTTSNHSYRAFDKNGDFIKDFESTTLAENKEDISAILKGSGDKIVIVGMQSVKPYTPIAIEDYDEYQLKKSIEDVENENKGILIKGNNQNGYAEVKLSQDQVYEGFFINGKPYGLALMHNNKDFSHLRIFNGTFKNEGFDLLYEKTNDGELMASSYLRDGYYLDYKTQILYHIILDENHKITTKNEMVNTGNTTGCLLGNCTNGMGYYKYQDGSTYIGGFKNGKLHHFGRLKFSNNDYYIGQFNNGNRTGAGEYLWSDGKYYRGEWQNNQRNGKGVLFYDKTTYEAGNFLNGIFNGKQTVNQKSDSVNSSVDSELEKIKKCQDFDCYKNLFETKAGSFYATRTNKESQKEFAHYMAKMHNANPGILFKILMKTKEEYVDLYTNSVNYLPKEIINDIKSSARNIVNDYNEHMNSKETQEKIKKNGGTIIKN